MRFNYAVKVESQTDPVYPSDYTIYTPVSKVELKKKKQL